MESIQASAGEQDGHSDVLGTYEYAGRLEVG